MAAAGSRSTYLIGLTGGIAAGKSTVSSKLASLGAVVVDTDKLAHRLYDPSYTTDVISALVEVFGNDVLAEDGSINRKWLGPVVFGDPAEMKKMNDIVHPAVREELKKEIEQLNANNTEVAVIENAILVETKMHELVDEVWVINTSRPVALERLMSRNNLSEEQAGERIDSQMSNEERVSYATVVINGDPSREDVAAAVESEWVALRERAGLGSGGEGAGAGEGGGEGEPAASL